MARFPIGSDGRYAIKPIKSGHCRQPQNCTLKSWAELVGKRDPAFLR
jgi:hypothetical protein